MSSWNPFKTVEKEPMKLINSESVDSSSDNKGNVVLPVHIAFGISVNDGRYSVDRIEYTVANEMVNRVSVYTTEDRFEAFDRFKILAATELH